MVVGTAVAERPIAQKDTGTKLDDGGRPPVFPPSGDNRDRGNGRPKKPHMTWRDQVIEGAKEWDFQRVAGLLVTRPMRDVIAGIGAIAKARKMEKGYLREVGEHLDHKTAVRRQHEEQLRKWDDWTNEHVRTMRVTGGLAIAVLAAGTLSVATAPAAVSI